MRPRLRVVGGLAGLAIAGGGMLLLGQYVWGNVTDYCGPYQRIRVASEMETPPLTRQVVLVIVDGLRDDVARTLPTFRRVGGRGSFLTARTGQPSLSLPGWTYLTTGAPPEISCVTTNDYEGPVGVDSIVGDGIRTAIAGAPEWRQLYGAAVNVPSWFAHDDPEIGAHAVRILQRFEPELMIVHLPDVDHVAHAAGVGPEYYSTARRADRIISGILQAARPDATVILTSDHGHVDKGGHGGPEAVVTTTPFAVGGTAIRTGVSGEISQADVAPTIAALLGEPRPSDAIGQVVYRLLDADRGTLVTIRRAQDRVATQFFSRAARAIGGEATDLPSFDALREGKARHDVLVRAPLVAVVLAALVGLMVFLTRDLDRRAIFTGVLVFLVVWIGVYFGRGLSLSFSHFNQRPDILLFMLIRAGTAVAAGILAGLVTGFPTRVPSAGRAFVTAIGTAGWIIVLLVAGAGVFVAVYGWGFTWGLPNFSATFGLFQVVIAAAAIGTTAALAGGAAVLGHRLRTRPRMGGTTSEGSR